MHRIIYLDLKLTIHFLFAFALGAIIGSIFIQDIGAAPPTARSDLMTRLAASTLSSHDISFTMTGSTSFASGETITIDFDEDGSEWSVDGASDAVGDYDFNDGTERTVVDVDGDCTGHSGANDVVVDLNDTSGVLTIEACGSYSASSSGATVNIELGTAAGGTDRVTNPVAGDYQLTIAGTYGDDSSDIAIEIISDDQVSITATVDESINFSISDNSVGFGTLSSSQTRYANGAGTGSASEVEAHNVIVGTNASSGYSMTITGNTLTSGSDTITAIGASATAASTGIEQFGMRATATGGSGSVTAPYDTSNWALDTAGFPDELASASAGSDDTTYSVRYVGNIASSTEAGAYTSTLTYIATATF